TALLQVSPKFTSPDVTDEELFAGGAAWGQFLREYADVYPHGVQVGNEANNKIVFIQRRALRDGATEEAAAREGRVMAERMAMAVVRFAEGVRSTCSGCPVTAGGLGNLNGPRREAAVMYLRFLAPYVSSGVVAPVLDVHVYRGRRSFARDGGGRVYWREDFGGEMGELLAEVGWPATTTFQSTEANVPSDDGWRSDA